MIRTLPAYCVIAALAVYASLETRPGAGDMAARELRRVDVMRQTAAALRDFMSDVEQLYQNEVNRVLPSVRADAVSRGVKEPELTRVVEEHGSVARLREMQHGLMLLLQVGGLLAGELESNADFVGDTTRPNAARQEAFDICHYLMTTMHHRMREGVQLFTESLQGLGLQPPDSAVHLLLALDRFLAAE